MEYNFSRGQWRAEDFLYAASVREAGGMVFSQGEDSIDNLEANRQLSSYAYVSMVLRNPLPLPLSAAAECSFERYGAPLIVLADELDRQPDGRLRYGHHIEVVAWEKGVNVWNLTPDPDAPRGQRTEKLAGFSFPIEGGERVSLAVEATGDSLHITVGAGGRSAAFDCPGILRGPVYTGITACEGENRFYSFRAG